MSRKREWKEARREEKRARRGKRNRKRPDLIKDATRSRLYRNTREKRIAGVCAGIADYLGWSHLFVRLAFIATFFIFNGMSIMAYLILWVILAEEPEDLYKDDEDKEFWTHVRREPQGTLKSLRHKFREMELRVESMESLVTSKAWQIDQELKQ